MPQHIARIVFECSSMKLKKEFIVNPILNRFYHNYAFRLYCYCYFGVLERTVGTCCRCQTRTCASIMQRRRDQNALKGKMCEWWAVMVAVDYVPQLIVLLKWNVRRCAHLCRESFCLSSKSKRCMTITRKRRMEPSTTKRLHDSYYYYYYYWWWWWVLSISLGIVRTAACT